MDGLTVLAIIAGGSGSLLLACFFLTNRSGRGGGRRSSDGVLSSLCTKAVCVLVFGLLCCLFVLCTPRLIDGLLTGVDPGLRLGSPSRSDSHLGASASRPLEECVT